MDQKAPFNKQPNNKQPSWGLINTYKLKGPLKGYNQLHKDTLQEIG